MKFKSIFNNLITQDLDNTKYFYQMLGFDFESEYTTDSVLCLKVLENVFIMFLKQEVMESFIKSKYKKHPFDNQIISFFVERKTDLDRFKDKLDNLLKHSYEAVESEYMSYISFKDNNGYRLEISCYK